ncbi:MAG: hypothetical protein ACE5OZ_07755 [Candidatus Heimdallarchaeota archaeon]
MTAAKQESRYFPGDTDLARYNITLIRLTLNRFSITSGASWDDYDTASIDVDWEKRGYTLRSKSTSTAAFMAILGLIGLIVAAIKARTK